jgi:hypothetical protein
MITSIIIHYLSSQASTRSSEREFRARGLLGHQILSLDPGPFIDPNLTEVDFTGLMPNRDTFMLLALARCL